MGKIGQHLSDEQYAAVEDGLKRLGVATLVADQTGVNRGTVQRIARQMRDRGELGPKIKSVRAQKLTAQRGAAVPDTVLGQAAPEEKPTPAHERRIIQLEDELREANRKLRDAHRDFLSEDAVLSVLGVMASTPAAPPNWLYRVQAGNGSKAPEVPVGIWSDWHMGEKVEPGEVSGANAYNIAIAEQRVRRLYDSTIDLCANHGPGNYPGIVINLLGDFVSGGLHPELAKTDEEEVIPAALRCRDLLIVGLSRMADAFGKVYVPCAAGNHGRGTPKPEFKRYFAKNFDWLIYQLLQRHFADDPRIHIDIRPSNEVHYRVYGQRYLAMHGDMLGVKGGDGIIGVIGPIMRGEVKTRGQASSLGNDYDVLLMGHWHQSLWLPRAIVANTLKGFDEYAKNALRASPSAPSQPLWFVHPSRGITSRWDLQVDEPRKKAKEWVAWTEIAA